MIELLNTEAALLGLLNEAPKYPYQIEQEVKYRDMRYWTELSMSTIYKILIKLEKKGLVTFKNVISSENRLQKLYSISKEGKDALREKTLKLISEPEHIKWQFDIGIYNSELLEKNQIVTALVTYRKALQEKIKGYEKLLEFLRGAGCPSYRFSLATRPVFIYKAEIQWINVYLKTIT